MAGLGKKENQKRVHGIKGAAEEKRVMCPYPNCGKSYSDRFAYHKHKKVAHKDDPDVKRAIGYERTELCNRC